MGTRQRNQNRLWSQLTPQLVDLINTSGYWLRKDKQFNNIIYTFGKQIQNNLQVHANIESENKSSYPIMPSLNRDQQNNA